MSNFDYCSEAEALADIYDGTDWDDEEWEAYHKLEDEYLQTTRKQRIKATKAEISLIKELPKMVAKETSMYYIIQDSRKDNTTLMLVDRRKNKQYFWTHDHSIALKCNKSSAEKILAKLKFNSARIVNIQEYDELNSIKYLN